MDRFARIYRQYFAKHPIEKDLSRVPARIAMKLAIVSNPSLYQRWIPRHIRKIEKYIHWERLQYWLELSHSLKLPLDDELQKQLKDLIGIVLKKQSPNSLETLALALRLGHLKRYHKIIRDIALKIAMGSSPRKNDWAIRINAIRVLEEIPYASHNTATKLIAHYMNRKFPEDDDGTYRRVYTRELWEMLRRKDLLKRAKFELQFFARDTSPDKALRLVHGYKYIGDKEALMEFARFRKEKLLQSDIDSDNSEILEVELEAIGALWELQKGKNKALPEEILSHLKQLLNQRSSGNKTGYRRHGAAIAKLSAKRKIFPLIPMLVDWVETMPMYEYRYKDIGVELYRLLKASPNQESIQKLKQVIQEGKKDHAQQFWVSVDVLSRLGEKSILPILLKNAKATEESHPVRLRKEAAIRALSQYAGEDVSRILLDYYFKADRTSKEAISSLIEANLKKHGKFFEKYIDRKLASPKGKLCQAICSISVNPKPWFLAPTSGKHTSDTARQAASAMLQATFLVQASTFCPNFTPKVNALLASFKKSMRFNAKDPKPSVPDKLLQLLSYHAKYRYSDSLYFMQFNISFFESLKDKGLLDPKQADSLIALFAKELLKLSKNPSKFRRDKEGGSLLNSHSLGGTVLLTHTYQREDKVYRRIASLISPTGPGKGRASYWPEPTVATKEESAARNPILAFISLLKEPKNIKKRTDLIQKISSFVEHFPHLYLNLWVNSWKEKTWHRGSGIAPYYLLPSFIYVSQAVQFLLETATADEIPHLDKLRNKLSSLLLFLKGPNNQFETGSYLEKEEANALAGLSLLPLLDRKSDKCVTNQVPLGILNKTLLKKFKEEAPLKRSQPRKKNTERAPRHEK